METMQTLDGIAEDLARASTLVQLLLELHSGGPVTRNMLLNVADILERADLALALIPGPFPDAAGVNTTFASSPH